MLNKQIIKRKFAAQCTALIATVILSACGGHGHSTDDHSGDGEEGHHSSDGEGHHSGDGDEGHHSGDNDAVGVPGTASEVDKTIEIVMDDTMRFVPDSINVEAGQTIRFELKNAGKVKHEMVIGELEYLIEHSALMIKFPSMEHDDPNMLLLDPEANGELIWTFSKAGKIDFACLQPGHYDAGMKGAVVVAK